ncbi:uncharacterized protein LOC115727349 [Rhodamnia argentea]|uniref:Uncharacterized protein LOC115727349 n=1 Tax=Rhodamnia argentea TaxID=178133 RepID=A0A8B8MTM9_9MYRT|nr:uncharacterized protein LOC115727349 [Rhodamnia argentea]
MGGCFSQQASDPSRTAKVISVDGELHEYPVPVSVSQVLHAETCSPSSPCFICNSDRLYYEEFVPALSAHDHLSPNQIYFVLPESKLQQRVTASDMAALAVKASVALQKVAKQGGGCRRRRKTQISPVLEVSFDGGARGDGDLGYGGPELEVKKSFAGDVKTDRGAGLSRSGSVRKAQRLSSKRMRLAVRSFRMKLSTIYEGSPM